MTSNSRLSTISRMLVDSQKGYEEAASIAKDVEVARLFSDRATRRAALIREFAGVLPDLAPGDRDGSLAGGAHRAFIELRRLVQDDTRVALGEVETGEDAFLEALKSAMNDNELAPAQRSAVARLNDEVRSDREMFASMKAMY